MELCYCYCCYYYHDDYYYIGYTNKKQSPWCLILTLANVGRFSNFFHQLIHKKILYVCTIKISTWPAMCCYTGCRFTIVSNSKLPQWPMEEYIPVTPHIWLIWSSGTLHPEIYGLPLPTFSLSFVATSHLVLEVFTRQLLLFGIVSPLTSVLAKLS